MASVRDGDVARLAELFERHHLAVFDYLVRMTGDRTLAEDLVQDVFVRVLRYRQTYRDDGRFDTWLFRIARNARADYYRARRATASFDDGGVPEPNDPTPGPAVALERDRDLERLRRALLDLRDDQRELIVLARYRGMTHDQIGELLGVEPGTVKVRLHRAVRQLRTIFLGLPETNPWTATTSPRLHR